MSRATKSQEYKFNGLRTSLPTFGTTLKSQLSENVVQDSKADACAAIIITSNLFSSPPSSSSHSDIPKGRDRGNSDGFKAHIKRETSLSHPDPAADSPSAALVNSHSPYLLTTYSRPPLVFVRGEGSYLWDLENRYFPLILNLT